MPLLPQARNSYQRAARQGLGGLSAQLPVAARAGQYRSASLAPTVRARSSQRALASNLPPPLQSPYQGLTFMPQQTVAPLAPARPRQTGVMPPTLPRLNLPGMLPQLGYNPLLALANFYRG